MKKKKLIGMVLAMVLVLSVGVVAYAAAGGFTMTYLPGTSDTVTNMPAADSGVGGQPYTVSDKIPQREGYEFLGWTLDYGVANTYTLTYQVTGDPTYGVPGDTATPNPVTGIREGSNVTLANALSTAWVTGDGSPTPTTATYRVNYLEVGTDAVRAPQRVVDNQLIGSTVTENAIDIPGWTLVGADTQPLTLKPNVEGKWTFTGWCSDEDCTQPISEVTNISADTTVYGKWVYTETTNENEITFYYEKKPAVQYTDYVVRYVDRTTDADIADPKKVDNQKVGDTVTAEAPAIIDNYDLDDDSVKTLTLQNGENEIIFYYKPAKANWTLRYVYINEYGDYVDIIDPQTGTGNVGSTVAKTRKSFAGYDPISPGIIRKTLTRNDTDNEFIFIYAPVD